jgi:cellulose synthase operon protein C
MILLFPEYDTLKLALAGSIVGPDVTLAPAVLTIDSQGRLYVEPEATLSRATMKNLDRIGVKGSKRHGSSVREKVANWLQIVPLQKNPAELVLASQTPVLFELESVDDLPVLVAEMLRLGNDKQSYRWFNSDDGTQRVLLRVLGPPYYTLLRAIDSTASGTRGAVRAYLEPTPRVWIEIGFTHPFAPQIRVPEEQMVLLRSPRHWVVLDESPFQDVYDILQFDLPKVPVGWNETSPLDKIAVPLKLAAGNAADVAELWVLRNDALEQLDSFVRDADANLTQRLTFAVAADASGQRVVVLRTRPSKLPPPVLPLENALGFKPFWKLPNLFLPAGKRLHPTLRRDAVRRLLADDPDQVVWLQPDTAGGFTPESVPDSAFRSLEDWVDYIIETNQQPLAGWIEATQFDFDSFACVEPGSPKPKPPDVEVDVPDQPQPTKPAAPPKPPRAKPGPQPGAKAELAPPPEVQPPSAWRVLREGLEEKFLDVDGPLDAAERQALWPKLAEANAGEGSQFEAAICWLNAMWSSDQGRDLALLWFRAEFPGGSLDAKEFDRRLAARKPSVEDLRAVAAGFLRLSYDEPVPAWLPERLPAVQRFFETHEGSLPVRAVWLVALRQAKLAGSDVLGLARVRDRLLLRLLEEGLRAERDLPTFLRYDGLKDSVRIRYAREKAFDLYRSVQKWTAQVPVNAPYVDLIFAFTMAKLGESSQSAKLIESAQLLMEKPIPWPSQSELDNGSRLQNESELISAIVSNYCYKAFQFRVDQATGKEPKGASMSEGLVVELDSIVQKGLSSSYGIKGHSGTHLNPFSFADYNIRRMLNQSRILETYGAQDPYVTSGKRLDMKELAELSKIRDKGRFINYVRRYYRNGIPTDKLNDFRLNLLHDAIPMAAVRADEDFAIELVSYAIACLNPKEVSIPKATPHTIPVQHGRILERAIALSSHYNQLDLISRLVDRAIELLEFGSEVYRAKFIGVIDRECFRALSRRGLQRLYDRFVTAIAAAIGYRSHDIYAIKQRCGEFEWPNVLQSLLCIAGNRLITGDVDAGYKILDLARQDLLSDPSPLKSMTDYVEVARAYVRAVSKSKPEEGTRYIIDLFNEMPPKKIVSNSTTSQYYSWYHLNLVEEACFALLGDSFSLSPKCHRWLEEDEYLVRNRIHADLKRFRGESGV